MAIPAGTGSYPPRKKEKTVSETKYFEGEELYKLVNRFKQEWSGRVPDTKRYISKVVHDAASKAAEDTEGSLLLFGKKDYSPLDVIAEVKVFADMLDEEIAGVANLDTTILEEGANNGMMRVRLVFESTDRLPSDEPDKDKRLRGLEDRKKKVLAKVKELTDGGAAIYREEGGAHGSAFLLDIMHIHVPKGSGKLALMLVTAITRSMWLMRGMANEAIIQRAESGLVLPALIELAHRLEAIKQLNLSMENATNTGEFLPVANYAKITFEVERLQREVMKSITTHNKLGPLSEVHGERK